MENKKRIYPSQQLVCALPPTALKTFLWLCGWQSQGEIKLYVRQMAKFLKMDESEVSQGIQTLKDVKLINIMRKGESFVCTLNGEQVDKYFKIPMAKIGESNGIQLSTDITWNKQQHTTNNDTSIEDLQRQILMLQAQLNEKKEVERMINTCCASQEDDGLPF